MAGIAPADADISGAAFLRNVGHHICLYRLTWYGEGGIAKRTVVGLP
eukprot:CAMPEP_0204203050 /NCGR_PEP_ID=MMETSP0361-20130328/68657_1 /ASSEMBLY_ACC=CAM_ASM_000343 /TAXON_ID=268821 /ORGANISM="Scrippsiella Hangoei, Strain SHTV-5" /LENGTH=46 /DNA_ID= /DNA_START= /DNA_END= /DNA_ORIENTATION=